MSVGELESLLKKRYEQSKKELGHTTARIKELEQAREQMNQLETMLRRQAKDLANLLLSVPEETDPTPLKGKTRNKGKIKESAKTSAAARKRLSRWGTGKESIITFLRKNGPAKLPAITKAVDGEYGTVAHLLFKLKKQKIVIQALGRGAPYGLAPNVKTNEDHATSPSSEKTAPPALDLPALTPKPTAEAAFLALI